MSTKGISVLILTLNEEVNLSGCLETVSWSDDIVVYDSFSADRTMEIAQQSSARSFQRKFDTYAGQRNAALNEIEYKNDWVLMVDADERWDATLYRKMKAAIAEHGDQVSIFYFTRNDYFFGKRLAYSLASTTWSGRLIKLGHVTVERDINEEYHTDGGKTFLPLKFEHYPFSKGIAWWFERHNRYSSMEALALIDEVEESFRFGDLWAGQATVRRKALKQLAYRIPGRPGMMFIYLYVVRFGFLDGLPGLRYSIMRSMYEYMIDLKVAELRYNQKKENI